MAPVRRSVLKSLPPATLTQNATKYSTGVDLTKFSSLQVSPYELCLRTTLKCGQSFSWQQSENGVYVSVLNGRIVELYQTADDVYYRDATEKPRDVLALGAELADYFQLHTNLADLYELWSAADPHFKKKAADSKWHGIRILRQDPLENVFSFICSSNNNIARITKMVKSLCTGWGTPLVHADTKVVYHAFPSLAQLAASQSKLESKLRNLGFGYRAKYIANSVTLLCGKGPEWLLQLRDLPYPEAKELLMSLPGVGPKVADCICLMSLDKTSAIPVDTHVWQIAKRDYNLRALSQKTMNAKLYQLVGDHFRNLHGPFAGWAHSVLFAADLTSLNR